MLQKSDQAELSEHKPQTPKKRRVSFIGWMVRLIVAVAILAGAGFLVMQMLADKPEPPNREPRERTFTVKSTPAEYADFQPTLTYFGEILAARTLDIRSQVAGEVLEIKPNIAVGTFVKEGDLIAVIDDFTYRGAVTEAQTNLADARLGATEAKEKLSLENGNLEFVKSQYDLSLRDLERAKSLFADGSLTEKSVEDRELVTSQRLQSVRQSESNLLIQQSQLERQDVAIERLEWQLERAQRNLENTKIYAPFDGTVTSKNFELGRIVSNNEALISIFETSTLDVRFTMSDQQYGQLVADGLLGREIKVTWEIDPMPIQTTATITRVGAQIDATKGGVEVFATIANEDATKLRPGTFVRIGVPGLLYENALQLPEAAVYDNSYVYIDEDSRMMRRDIQILARDGENLLVASQIEPGTSIITTRIAQAGDGVAIVNEGQPSPFVRPQRQQGGQGGEGRPEGGKATGAEGQAKPGQNGQRNPNRPNRRQNSGEAGGIVTKPGN